MPSRTEETDRERRRALALRLADAALAAVEPAQAVKRNVQLSGSSLSVAGREYDLDRYDRILVIGAGKAGAPMAQAIEETSRRPNYLWDRKRQVRLRRPQQDHRDPRSRDIPFQTRRASPELARWSRCWRILTTVRS